MNQISPSIDTAFWPTPIGAPCLVKPSVDSITSVKWTVLPANRDGHDELATTPVLPGQVVETELAGVRHYSHPDVLPLVWEGPEVWLVRNPQNYHDVNATAARRRIGRLLGYVPRGLAAELAPIFDAYGLPVPAIVNVLINGRRPFGIRIRFIVPQPDLPDDTPLHIPPEENGQLSPSEEIVKRATCGQVDSLHPLQNRKACIRDHKRVGMPERRDDLR